MTPRELKQFREMQRLREENREMEIIMKVWGFALAFAALLISVWGW